MSSNLLLVTEVIVSKGRSFQASMEWMTQKPPAVVLDRKVYESIDGNSILEFTAIPDRYFWQRRCLQGKTMSATYWSL